MHIDWVIKKATLEQAKGEGVFLFAFSFVSQLLLLAIS